MTHTKHILAGLLVAIAACGGGQHPKSGLSKGSGDVPPPPEVTTQKDKTPVKAPPVSVDAQKDYQAAADYFAEQDKAGWTEATCRSSADKFSAVAREHKMVEAQYMVGRSYHACNLLKDAEEAYQDALKINSNHAPTISNLGELYWQAGKKDGAKKYWEAAVKADPKIVAARANLAMLDIEQLRVTAPGDAWNKIEKDARDNLSSVLAVQNDNLKAYVLYGMLYMEGHERNKNRLDLAKLLLDQGAKLNAKYAPLEHAYGLYYLYKNQLTEALAHFQNAETLDDGFAEAHMNVGLIKVGFRKYDDAKTEFQKVLSLPGNDKNYDAEIGLGVAERGLGNLDDAEKDYKTAQGWAKDRGDAYFNLGVLYKDFRAAKQTDLKASQDNYRTARDYFKQFLDKDGTDDQKSDAKDNIGDCDKVIKQLDDFIKAQANQPPPTPDTTPPAGTGSGSGSGAGSGSGSGSAAPSGGGAGAGSGSAAPAPATPDKGKGK